MYPAKIMTLLRFAAKLSKAVKKTGDLLSGPKKRGQDL
jgi:hypothetical protein